MKKFGLYAWPAFATKKDNPYSFLIYSNIEKLGHPVHEFSLKRKKLLIKMCFSPSYKFFHIHWPHSTVLLEKRRILSWRRLIIFYLFIKIIKLGNKKIIWTVHNLESHEIFFPNLHARLDRILYKNVDGFISMNLNGIELIKGKIKLNTHQKISYIPHPHYKNYYANKISGEVAREKLNIPAGSFVFLFLGRIRTYKNLPSLLNAYEALKINNKLLLIAGFARNADKKFVKKINGNAAKIRVYDFFIKDDDLQVFLNASDLVVTPYSKVFNSGSIFLNLSFNKPTLVPKIPALSELHKVFGPHWIKVYNGDLSSEIMEQTMKEIIAENNKPLPTVIEKYNPEVIAKKTVRFYESFL